MAKIKTQNSKVPGLAKRSGAGKSQNWNLLLLVGATFIVIVSLINLGLWVRNEIAKSQRASIEQEIAKWKEVVTQTPTYRDGYLKLAALYWKLNEDEKAKEALDRAKDIDPNYEETENLRRTLSF